MPLKIRDGSRHRVRALFLFLLPIAISLLLVMACASTPSAPVIPTLSGSGIAQVRWLTDLVARSGARAITGLSSYVLESPTPAGSAAHVLVVVGEQVYAAGLDGSDLHQIPLDEPCIGFVAAAPDNVWAACSTQAGTALFSLRAGTTVEHIVLPETGTGRGLGRPAWSPDGRYLALARGTAGGGPAVAIFGVAPDRSVVWPVAVLAIVGMAVMEYVQWSPDGRWLAVGGVPAGSTGYRLYALSVGGILSHLPPQGSAPISRTVALQTLQSIAANQGFAFTWRPGTAETLTYLGDAGHSIVQQSMPAPFVQVLFTQHSAPICALSWTPDAHQLIFELCEPQDIDISSPLPQFYIFSPAEADEGVS